MMTGNSNTIHSGYVHLHNHTEYSLLDGAARISQLIKKAKEFDMPAVAMTDHGVLYGIVEFYKKAVQEKIKPILGCEVYITPGSMEQRDNRTCFHLLLLAENNMGYQNLIKIVSESWLRGFYYKPRIDKELLFRNSEGLIALSSCIQGEIPSLILKGDYQQALKSASVYIDIFGENNFFLELQDHNMREEKRVNSKLIKIAREQNIPLVVTNDVHYINKSDARLHDVLLALQTGTTIEDEDRLTFPNDNFYFKSEEEMRSLFPALSEAYNNTVKIAERCHVEMDFNTFHLPSFPITESKSHSELLRGKCLEGLQENGMENNSEAIERMEYELEIIEQMGYISYFLIVWDFVNYAEKNGIRVGPGRGSAAGSLVSYLLGITKVNPLEYNLIFERFLNPERVTMPDIDIDFDEHRDSIIEYVSRKYGQERVAQIGTFGTMAARAAIRDIGRALNIPLRKVDHIAKLIPGTPGITIDKAMEMKEKLQQYYQDDEQTRELIDLARKAEGLPRHISTHAAGIVIGSENLSNVIPLQKQDKSIITQLPMNDLESLGLLKMDFLGLRNLTIINKALNLISNNHSIELDIENIPFDDPEVYRLLQSGRTLGVFQMESYLFQDLNQKLKPDRFSDLIALLALGRPGPLGSGLVDQYIDSRHGIREPEYLHPDLEPILNETFGLILYQEQVMEIASKLGGYTMGEADLLRRGMGKKKKELMANERERFLNGALEKGIKEYTAHQIFDQMEYFAGYGFNKSHSTAYAMLAYQTAYLKVKYPAEFMAALLSTVMGNQKKVGQYIRECQEMGIEVLPPDINKSFYEFKPGRQDKIYYGLKAIKNVGRSSIDSIIESRQDEPYKSLEDFLQKVDLRRVNIQVIESLIKAGAFSSFDTKRSQLMVKYEELYKKISISRNQCVSGQTSFFDIVEDEDAFYQNTIKYPEIDELPIDQMLAQEKEYLGIYLSAHPLDQYKKKIKYYTNFDSSRLEEDHYQNENVIFSGMIINRKNHITKKNSMMAFLTVEDWLGKIDIVVFPEVYEKYEKNLSQGNKVIVFAYINEDSIIARDVILLDNLILEIKIDRDSNNDNNNLINKLKTIFKEYSGEIPVFFTIMANNKRYLTVIDDIFWVNGSINLKNELNKIIGKNKYRFV
ncbi:MAG: DNA polymerase III subunit alpha [Halanaerobiaceae bacterium]